MTRLTQTVLCILSIILLLNPTQSHETLESTSSSSFINKTERMLLGGYNPISPQDPNFDRIQKAAEFAFLQYTSGQVPSTTIEYDFQLPTNHSEDYVIKVFDAYQQVVAGMNYKFKLGIFLGDACVGGFNVTIYDRFGTLSVTNWGDELSCEVILMETSTTTMNELKDPE